MRALIIDALAYGRGKRQATRDVIGAGPRAIAGVLEESGIKHEILPADHYLTKGFNHFNFKSLLVSGMTSDLPTVRRIVNRWRKTSNNHVLIGGPIASDIDILHKVDADIAVIGEGESTLKELLKLGLPEENINLDELQSVRGITYRTNTEIQVNPLRPIIKRKDYDSLTPSTKTITSYPLYRSARVYVEVLRGCSNYHRARNVLPNGLCEPCELCRSGDLESRYDCPQGVPPGCGYCSVPSLYGPPRSRSQTKILEEINALLDLGVKRIVLSAPGFLDYGRDLLVEPQPLTNPRKPEPNYEFIEKLLSNIASIDQMAEGKASFFIENLKGELVTERAAETLGRYLSGTPVNIGFETGSESHCEKIGRSSTPKENLMAIRMLKKVGLKPYAYFVHGLPGQNIDTVKATVNAIEKSIKAGASRIILYRFQPLPMSTYHNVSRASPAAKDKLSNMIHEAATKANKRIKKKLVGSTIRVVISETYTKDHSYQVAYPMHHGPVVLVKDTQVLEGEIVDVFISEMVSDRIVRGDILK